MKIFLKIILLVSIGLSILIPVYVWAVDNLDTGNKTIKNDINNNRLNSIWDNKNFYTTGTNWEIWVYNTFVNIAKDMKNVLFIVASIYFIILILKVLYSDNSEEESANFKKWIIWISIGLIITQVSYWFVNTMFNKQINQWLASDIINNIVIPLVNLLQTIVSFLFIWVMIYAFYKMVTANGDEEKVKIAKSAIINAIIWFIAIKISKTLIESTYWKITCNNASLNVNLTWNNDCLSNTNLTWVSEIVVTLINWMNGFIWVIVIIMIIYTWSKVLLSAWNEETLKSAKTSIIYIAIWIVILVANYLILTFLIIP